MIKLKSFFTSLIKRDPFVNVLSGCAKKQQICQVIQLLSELPLEKKQETIKRFEKKLHRKNSKNTILCLLIVCQLMHRKDEGFYINLPEDLFSFFEAKSKIRINPSIKGARDELSYFNFLYFYLQYLQVRKWSQNHINRVNSFTTDISFFEKVIQSIKCVLKYDFVIEYCVKKFKVQEQQLFKFVTQQILTQISEDLASMIKFVNQWNHKIMEKSNESFYINRIYEQLLYICKNIPKFQWLARIIHLDIIFPIYKIDKSLNLTIEQTMRKRNGEKMAFNAHRRVMTETFQGNSHRSDNKKSTIKPLIIGEQDITESEIIFHRQNSEL